MSKKHLIKKLGLGIVLFMTGASAFAELPAPATSAIAAAGTAVTDAETAVWPVIGAVLVALVIIKLVKRFVSKI